MPQLGFGQDTDFIDEDNCVLCGGIQTSERESFRANLDKLELDDDKPVCRACFVAFWRNLGFPVRDHDLPEDEGKRIVLRRVN